MSEVGLVVVNERVGEICGGECYLEGIEPNTLAFVQHPYCIITREARIPLHLA